MSEEKKAETIRERAAKLFRPPFKFDGTYVWDSRGEMLADNRVPEVEGAVLQARGWGRLVGKYAMNLSEAEARELQQAYGELIAEALSTNWGDSHPKTSGQQGAPKGQVITGLAPCPFDRSENVAITRDDRDGTMVEFCFVECMDCGATGPTADTGEAAAIAWGERTVVA